MNKATIQVTGLIALVMAFNTAQTQSVPSGLEGAAASADGPATAQAPVASDEPTDAIAPIVPADAPAPAAQELRIGPGEREAALFPRPEVLLPWVAFWHNIFSNYSESQTLIHSYDDPHKLFAVLDYRDQAQLSDPSTLYHQRNLDEANGRDRVNAILKRLDTLQDTPEQMTAEERRIFAMYPDTADHDRFSKAVGSVRVQRGLRERTDVALETASHYLPEMERIFASYGLPTTLTRLPIVESSFNVNAYSKDGAAGIWQFIPAAARTYMRLNDVVDDRRDPWFSTDAAARHLKDDFDALHDWPLALTAYNYGRGGISRALVATNGTSLTDLLARCDNPRFGFASRSFYAEFLAATDVVRDYRRSHPATGGHGEAMRFEVVTTRDFVPYESLRRLSGLDPASFHTLNPAYRPEVLSGRLYVPPGHPIRVAAGTSQVFMENYALLPVSERLTRQHSVYLASARLQHGETLAKFAARYGLNESEVLAANDLKSEKSVRPGQKLKIPSQNAPTLQAAVFNDATRPARAIPASLTRAAHYRHCTVQSGQTLGEIAKRYQTSITILRALNDLGTKQQLKVGSVLKVPLG